jgi:hypothetical protein
MYDSVWGCHKHASNWYGFEFIHISVLISALGIYARWWKYFAYGPGCGRSIRNPPVNTIFTILLWESYHFISLFRLYKRYGLRHIKKLRHNEGNVPDISWR